ncbi:MAG: LytR/AlgR family response regulator transcription factor [Bacteroidia bacterium]
MRILLIEDEELAAERLSMLLQQYDPAIQILDVLDSVKGSVQWLNTHPAPDLLLLDIHLGDGLSFQIFDQISTTIPVIFTTAFDEYAIRAFKHQSIDYLLKPIRREELHAALDKFKSWQGEPTPSPDLSGLLQLMKQQQVEYRTRFSIIVGTKIKTIDIAEVAYFFSQQNITMLVSKQGQHYPVDFSLEQLAQELNPAHFFRINRQFLLHISAIKQVHIYPKSRLKIELKPETKEEVFVSIDKVSRFKDWLDGK